MGSPGDPRVAGDTRGLQWRREMQKAARERPERCGGGGGRGCMEKGDLGATSSPATPPVPVSAPHPLLRVIWGCTTPKPGYCAPGESCRLATGSGGCLSFLGGKVGKI